MVRVRVVWVGVNFADVLCRRGQHPAMRLPPITIGCEAAGVVDAVGEGPSEHRVGDRVAVYSPFGGAYAEFLCVPARYALAIPASMALDVAAAFVHVYLTAWMALHDCGRSVPRGWLLVTAAAGGLGVALTQLGAAYGLGIISAVGSPDKRRALLASGARHVIDYSSTSLSTACLGITADRGVDIAVETVGSPLFEDAVRSLAPLGRIVMAGVAGGRMPGIDLAELGKRSAACSSLNVSAVFAADGPLVSRAWLEICGFFELEQLTPLIHSRFELADAAESHRLMESRLSTGKILLKVGTSLA
jgi:NADPH2:quinone reductase